jgi:hypothetical protein
MDLDRALDEIASLLVSGERHAVSWSMHDRDIVTDWCSDPALVDLLTERHRDGKKTAKRWLAQLHPDTQLPKEGFGGAHKLNAYAEMFGVLHPPKYGENVAAEGIRSTIAAFAHVEHYSELAKRQRDAWTRVLGHNYWDCYTLHRVVTGAAGELEDIR